MVARVDGAHSGYRLASWLLRVTKIFWGRKGSMLPKYSAKRVNVIKIFWEKGQCYQNILGKRVNVTMLKEAKAPFTTSTCCEGVRGVRA